MPQRPLLAFGKVANLTVNVPVKQLYSVAVDASGSLRRSPVKTGLAAAVLSAPRHTISTDHIVWVWGLISIRSGG